MTTTDQTARDVIAEALRLDASESEYPGTYERQAYSVLDSLTAAGYAVVRLPDPDETGDDGYACWGDADVESHRDGDGIESGGFTNGTPSFARRVAAYLLAAADQQDGPVQRHDPPARPVRHRGLRGCADGHARHLGRTRRMERGR